MSDAPALVHEACRRSAVVWLSVPGRPPRLVWHVWHEGSAYVLHGGGEQYVEGLAETTAVEVTVRSTHTGGRLVGWAAATGRVTPGDAAWEALVPLLRKARLHAEPDPTGRWAATSTLTRLTPTGEVS